MTMGSMPPAGPPRAYAFPPVTRSRLGRGTRVVTASLRRAPLVTVTLVLHRAGADADPLGKEGLASLTAAMLLEGTESMDGATLAERFEGLGSSLAASADWDAAALSFTVQTSRLASAMTVLGAVIAAPAFREHDLDRLRAEHGAERLQVMADPRALAGAALAWSCYDSASRYSRPLEGTRASVASLMREDLVGFWRARYAAGAATLIFAGDVDHADSVALAEALDDQLQSTAPSATPVRTSPRDAHAGVTLVERAGAPQTELRVGHLTVPRRHPDFFPMTVMNAVLGGLFSSRINLNLRERHGYTYGASSVFDWRVGAGPWFVSTAVNTDATTPALAEIRSEIDRIRSAEIDGDELDLAIRYLTGVFPLRFETTAAVAAALAAQATFELPEDYFDTYRERIAAVTPHAVMMAARDHLAPDRLQIVAVGDPASLSGGLSTVAASYRTMRPDEIEAAP